MNDLSEMRKPYPDPLVEDRSDMKDLPTEKGGADGWGRLTHLLPSMRATDDMGGLSLGSS